MLTLPPPPPLLISGTGAAPVPPGTPRDELAMTLPGVPEMLTPRSQSGASSPTSRRWPGSPSSAGDFELMGAPGGRLALDPQHMMMPPLAPSGRSPSPPLPPPRVGPPPSLTASIGSTSLPRSFAPPGFTPAGTASPSASPERSSGLASSPSASQMTLLPTALSLADSRLSKATSPTISGRNLPLALIPPSPGGQLPRPPKGPPPRDALGISSNQLALPGQVEQLALPERDQADARLQMVLAPLRHQPGHGKIPALPRDQPPMLSNAVLAKIPSVRLDSGLVPPPPPPPVGGFGQLATLPLPPQDGEPVVHQKLALWQPGPRRGGPPTMLPRPPPKMPAAALRPTPPKGPPPAHAIVLARTAGVPGFDQHAIVRASEPPTFVPKPPAMPPPPDVRPVVMAMFNKQAVDDIARQREADNKNMTIEGLDPFAAARKDPRNAVITAKKAHDEKAPKPVPDYLVTASIRVVWAFVASNILVFGAIISIYGTYLPAAAIYPTYVATAIGMFMNLGLFESVKCVVICCLALVHEESMKRDAEMRARRFRMELKSQRVFQRGRRLVNQHVA